MLSKFCQNSLKIPWISILTLNAKFWIRTNNDFLKLLHVYHRVSQSVIQYYQNFSGGLVLTYNIFHSNFIIKSFCQHASHQAINCTVTTLTKTVKVKALKDLLNWDVDVLYDKCLYKLRVIMCIWESRGELEVFIIEIVERRPDS